MILTIILRELTLRLSRMIRRTTRFQEVLAQEALSCPVIGPGEAAMRKSQAREVLIGQVREVRVTLKKLSAHQNTGR